MPQRFEMLQKQTQRMILSPQMQQAIYMLQMPLMELQTLIHQEMATNPVLEETMEQETPSDIEKQELTDSEPESELKFKEEFDVLTKLDDEWKDYFRQSGSFRKFTQQDEEKRKFMMDSLTTSESLHDHLLQQLGLFTNDPEQKKLGELIIGNIDDNGYLKVSSEELVAAAKVSLEKIEKAISFVQNFNPVGVGARDLKECLLIQIERLGIDDPVAELIIENHMDLLAQHKYTQIAQSIGIDENQVRKKVELITTLDPKPGLIFSTEKAHYITPDVFVEKVGDNYIITLNDERIPHLHISKLYRNLLSKKETPKETRDYIKQKLMAGNWLIKNIHQRQQTISKIATEIVNVQRGFLDEGPAFLKPLTMQEVANNVSLHESTISRAIANKYIQTPQGTFQFKYFFTSGIQTGTGEMMSIVNLKQQIASMIKEEDTVHPLSDQDIINKLQEEGIKLARRTVAKYRQELGIPASNIRKRA